MNKKDKNKMEFIQQMRQVILSDIATRHNYKDVEKAAKRISKETQKVLGEEPMGLIVLAYAYLVDLLLMECIEEIPTPFPVAGPMKINLPPAPKKIQ